MKLHEPIKIYFIPIPMRIEIIHRKCEQNRYTKVYNFDRFSQLPFKSKRKRRVCEEKPVFLHLSLSVKGNGLVWKRRSILAELC